MNRLIPWLGWILLGVAVLSGAADEVVEFSRVKSYDLDCANLESRSIDTNTISIHQYPQSADDVRFGMPELTITCDALVYLKPIGDGNYVKCVVPIGDLMAYLTKAGVCKRTVEEAG